MYDNNGSNNKGLNKIVIVMIIIIKAVGVDQPHEAVDGSTTMDPDPGASE